jgi:hypothetical protein
MLSELLYTYNDVDLHVLYALEQYYTICTYCTICTVHYMADFDLKITNFDRLWSKFGLVPAWCQHGTNFFYINGRYNAKKYWVRALYKE